MPAPSNPAAASVLAERIASLARASELLASGASVFAWPPGWPELEVVLPGGVPRGKVTEWAGPRSAGKTAVLRRMVSAIREAGVGAAYVDGTGTLAPASWIFGRPGPDGPPPFWVVRPPAPPGVLAAVEELLRSGAFGLVIAEGADWSRAPVIRLQRLAREASAALIAVVDRAGRVPLAGCRVEFSPAMSRESGERRVVMRGRIAAREVVCVQGLPYRLPEDAGLPDRRGSGNRSSRSLHHVASPRPFRVARACS